METWKSKTIAKLMLKLPKEVLEQEIYDLLVCSSLFGDYEAYLEEILKKLKN